MIESKKRTPAKIRDALVKMLETTPLEDVTVTALCENAGINRATFYYHYQSVNDVFIEIERNIESEFTDFISKSTVNSDGTPATSFYVTFFEFVARNAGICRMLVNSPHKNAGSFLSRAMQTGRVKVIATMTQIYPRCPVSKIEYYYLFVSHGFLGLLLHWLNSGMRESVEEIAKIGEDVSYRGIKFLE